MLYNTETIRLNRIIRDGANSGMSELEFFALSIAEWKKSPLRRDQILGEQYYRGEHEILERKRTAIGNDGELKEVKNLPNNRIIDNQYAKMVDQKTNYLLGKKFSVDTENKAYAAALNELFDNSFRRTLKYIGEDSLNGGIGWLYLYYNEQGEFRFRRFPAYEILPFWKDDDHSELDCAVRMYLQEAWEGYYKKIIEKVEIYKRDGIYRYILDGNTLVPDVEIGERLDYFTVLEGKKSVGYNWQRIPLIAFKANNKELPLIKRVKSLQDTINLMLSDFANNMQEDARNTILVINNYDGTDLGEFRQNLATYGAVKVRSESGADGGVDALTVEVNADNYKAILELLKKALIENARGFDGKDDRIGANPNQMNIQSMYSDIDLDANGMETEFCAAFDAVLWFVNQHLMHQGKGDFSTETADIIFNRDIMVSESEAIDNCSKSVGILSNETIVGMHPWTVDVEKELQRIKDEREEIDDEANNYNNGAFANGHSHGGQVKGGEANGEKQ